MALLDLYGGDLSLFEGQVLAGLNSPLDDEHLSFAGDGGIQLELTKTEDPTIRISDQQVNVDTDLFKGFGQSVEVKEVDGINRWLDVNVDLLDLLAETQDQSFNSLEDLSPPLSLPQQDNQLTALEVLQSLADETEKELASSNSFSEPSSPVTPIVVRATGDQGSEMVVTGGPSSVLMEMLLQDSDLTVQSLGQQQSVMDIDVDEHLVLEASAMPILSPVSPDDVESLLSSGPCSPDSVAYQFHSGTPEDSDYLPNTISEDESWLPKQRTKQGSRAAPYSKLTKGARETKGTDRKQRKKQQNRDAALRYRQKKKAEANVTESECETLEKRNNLLKDKCDQMTREIQYLKDLMADVYHARGLKFKLPTFE